MTKMEFIEKAMALRCSIYIDVYGYVCIRSYRNISKPSQGCVEIELIETSKNHLTMRKFETGTLQLVVNNCYVANQLLDLSKGDYETLYSCENVEQVKELLKEC